MEIGLRNGWLTCCHLIFSFKITNGLVFAPDPLLLLYNVGSSIYFTNEIP